MAGHSRWHNIRLRKGKQDAQRARQFTRASREILLAVRQGGPDPEANFRLKVAIQRAREVNMPNSNIERAIEKAAGGGDDEPLEELVYEGYGPSGVAIMVEAATDNRNRTAAELRALFAKAGGNLGETGCVAWLFDRRGLLTVPAAEVDEEALLMAALEAGALDMQASGETFEIYTEPAALHQVKQALERAGLPVASAEFAMLARNTVKVDRDTAPGVLRLMEQLEEHGDVQNVHANLEIDAEVLEEIQAGAG